MQSPCHWCTWEETGNAALKSLKRYLWQLGSSIGVWNILHVLCLFCEGWVVCQEEPDSLLWSITDLTNWGRIDVFLTLQYVFSSDTKDAILSVLSRWNISLKSLQDILCCLQAARLHKTIERTRSGPVSRSPPLVADEDDDDAEDYSQLNQWKEQRPPGLMYFCCQWSWTP